MSAERLSRCLDSLSQALGRLDHAAVARQALQLEEIRLEIRQQPLNQELTASLLVRLRLAEQLTRHAAELYEGWSRISAPPGSAYTANGSAPHSGAKPGLRVEG